jgi:hypothetical protein
LAQRVSTLPAGGALVDLVERALAGEVSGITGTSQARLNAIFSDNVHMTNLGSYYLGLVSHATVFRKSSVGTAAPAGINAATAADLQEIAWNYVSTYLNSYVEPSMASCRTLMDNQYCNSYHSFRGNSGNVNNCRNHYIGANSPFRWPDANWVNHAAP